MPNPTPSNTRIQSEDIPTQYLELFVLVPVLDFGDKGHPAELQHDNIYFENNTCVDAGTTWATYPVDQRTPGRGEGGESISSRSNWQPCMTSTSATTSSMELPTAPCSIAYWGAGSWNDLANLTLE